MSMTLEDIFQEAQKLSPDDRERLVEMLAIDVSGRPVFDDELTPFQRADLAERISEWRANPTCGEPIAAVSAEIERRLADVRRHRDGASQARSA